MPPPPVIPLANRPTEKTPLIPQVDDDVNDNVMNDGSAYDHYSNIDSVDDDDEDDNDDDYFDGAEVFESLKEIDSERRVRRESLAADRLSMRLLAISDDDEELEDQILKETLDLDLSMEETTPTTTGFGTPAFGSGRRRNACF